MWYGVPHRAVVCWKHTREGINHETDACTKYRAAARTEQQAQRRAAACKNALVARRLAVYQTRRTEWQAGQPLR